MSRRAVVLLSVLFVAVVSLAGCFGGPLSQEEAEARAESAVAAFASALGGGDGKIQSMKGSMSMESEPGMGMGSSVDVDMEMEWGQDGVVRVTVGMKSGGMTYEITIYCSPSRMVLAFGEDIYEGRADAEAEDGDLCKMDGAQEMGDPSEMFGKEEFERLEQTTVEPQGDGSVKATYTDPEDGTVFTFLVDKKGRLVHMEMTGDEGEGSFDMSYGARERITIPAASSRIPADAQFTSEMGDGTMTGTVTSSPQRPPLSEMQVHVATRDWESDERTVHASFDADQGTGQSGLWSFSFDDADGDGRLSENDTFTVSNPEWEDPWAYDVEFYDAWAEGYANEGYLPGPAWVLVVAGVVGLAAVLRRRT